MLPDAGFRRAKAEITAWSGYRSTPLRDLRELTTQLGVAVIRIKDESERFGLGSFKALGGAYAVFQVIAGELARRGLARAASSAELAGGQWREAVRAITVTCATDGNHGRAVAWGAQRFGCRAVIFVHRGVSEPRAAAIAAYGAEVPREGADYDEAVREAARVAEAEGWFIVSDTSWPGYTEIPRAIMQAYRLMADEAADAWRGEAPTHVFIQAGVGAAAAAVAVQTRARFRPAPALIVVEPDRAACLLASAEFGERTAVPGPHATIMAGLACGEPSLLAWRELDRAACAFMSVPDGAVEEAMRMLTNLGIVAGESGAAGIAGALLAASDVAARAALGLDRSSRVLLFNTEGATDPDGFARITGVRPDKVSRQV